jgi:Fe2+ or Zn2+ uptake regulation protein
MNDEGFVVSEIHQYFKGICPSCKQQNENQGN